MTYTSFPGQLPGEHILHTVQPHPIAEFLGYVIVGFTYIVWTLFSLMISPLFGRYESVLQIFMTIIGLSAGGYGLWWVVLYKKETVTFITDKGLICYRVVRPKKTISNNLDWTAAEKAVSVFPNTFWKIMNIASVHVYPSEKSKNIQIIPHVVDGTDLAGYMNNIIIITHGYPETISTVRPYDLIPRHLRNPKRDA